VSLPALLVAIAVVAATGPGLGPSMLAIGFVAAAIMARVTRNVVLAAREEDYVDGARVSGARDRRILVRHLLPNVAPALIVQATLLLAAAVLAEAALSFLGLGAVPPQPSWGVMLNQARAHFDDAPLLAVWPGLCIFLTVLAFNQLGDRTADEFGRGGAAPLDTGPLDRVVSLAERAPVSGRAPALELRRVSVSYGASDVVADVSLTVGSGEIFGLVGESGAGKSTIALAALGLVPAPGRTRAESIAVAGVELAGMAPGELRHVRGRHVGYVAQDPAAALNPCHTVGHQIAEPLRWHLGRARRQAKLEAAEWLERVGLAPTRARDYPHAFSGGELQRIALAMALACDPALLIADEPTTALDAVVQAQVLDLLLDLRDQSSTAMLLVSHDLAVVAGAADRVAVMRAGRIVEIQETIALFDRPQDPYTQQLLAVTGK
jgi:peptide/nickel transport system permease protein